MLKNRIYIDQCTIKIHGYIKVLFLSTFEIIDIKFYSIFD